MARAGLSFEYPYEDGGNGPEMDRGARRCPPYGKGESVMAEEIGQSPKLIVKYRGSVVKDCIITQPEFTIGRKPENDLVIEDPAVSGRHARIVKIQAVYFIEDLQSTNGTLVNGNTFDRKQLHDADVVMIGKHRLVFLEEEKSIPAVTSAISEGADQTVFLKSGSHGSKSKVGQKVGVVQVIAGRTDRSEYRLTNPLTVIGAHREAFIRLTGFFAPKTAATIGRRGEGYFITVSGKRKKVHINNVQVKELADLNHGDLLEVAGVKMYFYVKDAA